MRPWLEKTIPALSAAGATLAILLHVYTDRTVPFTLTLELLGCYFLATLIHETGHVIGVALGGFRLVSFACWFVEIYRRNGRWRPRRALDRGLAGAIRAMPMHTDHLRRRYTLLVASGPAASLLTALLCLTLPSPTSRWVAEDVAALGWWSLFIGITALIPMTTPAGQATDGARLKTVLRRGPAAERACAILALQCATASGLRPRDWDPDLMGIAAGDTTIGRMLLYNNQFDTGKHDAAWNTLQAILAGPLPPPMRPIYRLEAAWFQALVRRDAEAARPWLVETEPNSDCTCALWKARAALACVEQRWEAARVALDKASTACDVLDDPGAATAIRDSLRKLQAEVERGRQSALDPPG